MNIKSTSDRYGSVAIVIHWLSALLILALLVSGFRISNMEDVLAKASLLRFHVPLGIGICMLTVLRVIWWILADRKPQPVKMPAWQRFAASFIHGVLYVVIIGMIASGIGMMILSEAAPIVFNSSGEGLPNFWDYAPRIPHGLGARFLIVLLALHIFGALYHQFITKDGVIRRMWFK
ncbi:cytochrome b/b6 domain-containing protein [Vibrio sp. Isolate22]|uniref:cytochrome b n=1 Tax=Vibrio sp. Isolate22 TaxID=2908532 RepID=UPI001EFEE9FF|nr:cytochrome b/b6 domain-containing protein [Vibrio sp. Isolate22]MCG9694729.1 cytochrome b/b6 domain-containing protein [Vibrio sp. Isolate22]